MARSFADRWTIDGKQQAGRRRPPRCCPHGWKDRTPELSFQLNRPLIWRYHMESNPTGIARNRAGKAIGPFNDADAVAKNVLLKPDCFQRREIFHSIEIEMINGQSSAAVLMQEC